MKNSRVLSSDYKYVRIRSPNFTDTDRQLLLQLIMPYIDVIENKNSERAICIAKKQAWNKITTLYNGHHNVRTSRTLSQLKLFYEAIKFKMRRDKTEADQVSLNEKPKTSSPVIEQNSHMDGDVVMLNIISENMASSSQRNDMQIMPIKLEKPDSDSELNDNLNPKNLTLPTSQTQSIQSAFQAPPGQYQSGSTQNPQRFSYPPTQATLIKLQMKFLYEKHIMKCEQHKLKMQVLLEQLRKAGVPENV